MTWHLKSIPSLIHLTLNLIDRTDRSVYTGNQHPVFGVIDEVVRGYQPEPTKVGLDLCSSITVCGHSDDGVVTLRYTLEHRHGGEGAGAGMHHRYHLAEGEIPEYFPPMVDDGEWQCITIVDDDVEGTGKTWAETARQDAYGPVFRPEWDQPEMPESDDDMGF